MKPILIATVAIVIPGSFLVAVEPIPATSIKWTGQFGACEATPRVMYCIIARGFFQMATSRELSAMMEAWMNEHPKAVAIPVASTGSTKDTDSKITFVWIIDGDSNLNVELVRNGCFQPQTQTIGKGQTLEAPQADYDAFVQKVVTAGVEAKEKKLGVWKEPEPPR